ncbi:hypothetical protein [Pyxidicoccus trucidator]|uniref:hypothetical protein n=1 Tax=Pyxidicoccus trucidator TaxID=2709662 RepID=UPI0013D95941|nr:hypothetical protein [Pyxidicoccus trucidator]
MEGGTSACEPFGRYGAPGNTITLPAPTANGELYIPDVWAQRGVGLLDAAP